MGGTRPLVTEIKKKKENQQSRHSHHDDNDTIRYDTARHGTMRCMSLFSYPKLHISPSCTTIDYDDQTKQKTDRVPKGSWGVFFSSFPSSLYGEGVRYGFIDTGLQGIINGPGVKGTGTGNVREKVFTTPNKTNY